jgi:hypothetical protein
MLFPVVLFGAVWADLNRPTSEAEWNRYAQAFDRRVQATMHGQPPLTRAWASRVEAAYQCVRGRVQAARPKQGMTIGDPERLFGAASGQSWSVAGSHKVDWCYNPIGVCVCYRLVPRKMNGKDDTAWVISRVETTPLSHIGALLLPDWTRRR